MAILGVDAKRLPKTYSKECKLRYHKKDTPLLPTYPDCANLT